MLISNYTHGGDGALEGNSYLISGESGERGVFGFNCAKAMTQKKKKAEFFTASSSSPPMPLMILSVTRAENWLILEMNELRAAVFDVYRATNIGLCSASTADIWEIR